MSNIFNNKKSIILMVMTAISFVAAGISIFLSQDIFDTAAGKDSQFSVVNYVILVVAIIVLLILVAFLRGKTVDAGVRAKEKANGIGTSMIRIVLFVIFAILVACALSLLSGLLSVAVYGLFKNIMTLNTIKGVLNAVIALIFLITAPLFVSSFWETMRRNGAFLNVLSNGLKPGWKKYIKILLALLVLSAVGFLLSTAFNYAADSILIKILKTIIFGTTGTIGMYVTYSICGKD